DGEGPGHQMRPPIGQYVAEVILAPRAVLVMTNWMLLQPAGLSSFAGSGEIFDGCLLHTRSPTGGGAAVVVVRHPRLRVRLAFQASTTVLIGSWTPLYSLRPEEMTA